MKKQGIYYVFALLSSENVKRYVRKYKKSVFETLKKQERGYTCESGTVEKKTNRSCKYGF